MPDAPAGIIEAEVENLEPSLADQFAAQNPDATPAGDPAVSPIAPKPGATMEGDKPKPPEVQDPNVSKPPDDEKLFELDYENKQLKKQIETLMQDEGYTEYQRLVKHLQENPTKRQAISEILRGRIASHQAPAPEVDEFGNPKTPAPLPADADKRMKALEARERAWEEGQRAEALKIRQEREAISFLSEYNELAKRYPWMKESVHEAAIKYDFIMDPKKNLLQVVKAHAPKVKPPSVPQSYLQKKADAPPIMGGGSGAGEAETEDADFGTSDFRQKLAKKYS